MRTALRWGAALILGLFLTASIAIFFLQYAKIFIDVVRDTLYGFDWRYVALWTFLGCYLGMSVSAWSHTIKNWAAERSDGSSILRLAILRPILFPILGAIAAPFFALYALLYALVLQYLHFETRKIIDRAIAVSAFIWSAVFTILLFANLWPTPDKKACSWVFPKILSCVLSNYENLAGGVIGSAGAIFAAWLAWVAVQAQIRATSPFPQPEPSDRVTLPEAFDGAAKWGTALFLALAMVSCLFFALLMIDLLSEDSDRLMSWFSKFATLWR